MSISYFTDYNFPLHSGSQVRYVNAIFGLWGKTALQQRVRKAGLSKETTHNQLYPQKSGRFVPLYTQETLYKTIWLETNTVL